MGEIPSKGEIPWMRDFEYDDDLQEDVYMDVSGKRAYLGELVSFSALQREFPQMDRKDLEMFWGKLGKDGSVFVVLFGVFFLDAVFRFECQDP